MALAPDDKALSYTPMHSLSLLFASDVATAQPTSSDAAKLAACGIRSWHSIRDPLPWSMRHQSMRVNASGSFEPDVKAESQDLTIIDNVGDGAFHCLRLCFNAGWLLPRNAGFYDSHRD